MSKYVTQADFNKVAGNLMARIEALMGGSTETGDFVPVILPERTSAQIGASGGVRMELCKDHKFRSTIIPAGTEVHMDDSSGWKGGPRYFAMLGDKKYNVSPKIVVSANIQVDHGEPKKLPAPEKEKRLNDKVYPKNELGLIGGPAWTNLKAGVRLSAPETVGMDNKTMLLAELLANAGYNEQYDWARVCRIFTKAGVVIEIKRGEYIHRVS